MCNHNTVTLARKRSPAAYIGSGNEITVVDVDRILFAPCTQTRGNPVFGISMFRRSETVNRFKAENSLARRKMLSEKIIKTHADRLPVILLKVKGASRSTPDIGKTKFLAPQSFTVQQLLLEIRRSFGTLRPEQAIYLFVGDGVLVPSTSTIAQVYERFKDEDGFLYIYYSAEETFG